MTKEPKIPIRIRRLIAHCRDSNQTLCRGLRHSDVGESNIYWLEPSNIPVGKRTFEQALELGLFEACSDGLFNTEDSQTYRFVQ